MSKRLLVTWAALRWVLLMFFFTQALEAPLVARPSQVARPLRVWTGEASWYGPRFHGRVTANGETFDMYAATAAHPTLPFGSLVRVVNPATRRSQLVRINDRGPYVNNREIDLSYWVAWRLGMDQKGIAQVRLELVEVPQRHPKMQQSAD